MLRQLEELYYEALLINELSSEEGELIGNTEKISNLIENCKSLAESLGNAELVTYSTEIQILISSKETNEKNLDSMKDQQQTTQAKTKEEEQQQNILIMDNKPEIILTNTNKTSEPENLKFEQLTSLSPSPQKLTPSNSFQNNNSTTKSLSSIVERSPSVTSTS